MLQDFDGPVPKLVKGETALDAIERLRRRGRELKPDLHRIRSAPFPSSWAKQRLREMVDQLAARGAPDPTNLLEHDGEIIWPSMRLQSEVIGAQRSLAFHEAVDVVGMLAWLHKDALIKKLDALVASEADDEAALTHEARREREAELLGDLLEQERIEAAVTGAQLTRSCLSNTAPTFHRSPCLVSRSSPRRAQPTGTHLHLRLPTTSAMAGDEFAQPGPRLSGPRETHHLDRGASVETVGIGEQLLAFDMRIHTAPRCV